MNIILKKAVKDFKNLGWRSYLMIGTIILCLGGGLGLYYGVQAAMPMMDQYFDDANHADYTYQLSDDTWITQAQLDGLKNLDEVDEYTGRLFWTTSLKLPGQNERKYILLVGLEDSKPDVYDHRISKGEDYDNDDNLSAVIDQTFAEENNLDVGKEIEIDGLFDAELNIMGLCNAPEFVTMTSNPELVFPIEGSMAVIYLAKDTLKNYILRYFTTINSTTSSFDYTDTINYYKFVDYNNIAVTFKDDISEGNSDVKDYLRDNCLVNIEKSERFEDSYTYKLMESDINDSGEIMMILMLFMVFLATIIVYIIFNRYVNSQKQQIGILLGLGYTKKDILKYFIFNILLISLIAIPAGIVVGYGLGYLMLNAMLAEITHMTLFEFPFVFIPEVLYAGLLLGITLVFFSTFFSVRKINKQIIAELIYEQSEVTHKIKKIKETSKPRSITNRLVFRNLFRNKKRLVFTIIAMTFSLLIVSATESLLDSMYYNIDRTFKGQNNQINSSEKWDLNVVFQESVNTSKANNLVEKIKTIADIDDVEVYTKGLIIAKAKGEKEDQNLILKGIDIKNNDFHEFSWEGDKRDNSAPEKIDEIVISSVSSSKLDKELGDKLTVINEVNEEFKFKIVGIHNELVVTPYITLEAGKSVLHNKSNLIDGIYVILDGDVERDDIIEEIYDLGNIEVILDSKDMNEKSIEFINNYSTVLYIIIIYTLLVSFFIVFYNSVMNIYDKNYEYGIMRSLGYSKKSIFKSVLIENILQGLLPIILALVFTYPLAFYMSQVYAESFAIEVIVGLPAILWITIPPMILYILGSFVGLRTVYKQNLYEQVQTRFVG